ncbi:TetR/AcrR family transcriptional regulator [Candidatus Frankia alpina]|uniref:TetR/AcrR family transcriptional regulator n=1 Tax=Candidatus Frankia alpina TaxID=2699483 RepID=UPI001F426F17|nr:TetR family transcriptional regulator [Candidatus Frankia alpina]
MRCICVADFATQSVETIAAQAGAAKHTVYNHFGDKLGLLREVIAAELRRLARSAVATFLRAFGPLSSGPSATDRRPD